ncbi:MAG: 3'-5' exonuclease [Prochlorothrix sp.]
MLLLILDFETTGLSPDTARPIELGTILYSVEHHTPLAQVSTLIPTWDNPAQAINRISPQAAQAAAPLAPAVLTLISQWMDQSDYIVAHNASFDRRWLGLHGMPPCDKPWLCTLEDFCWPQATKKRNSLINLALEHGIGVSSAHRALTDCQLIAALFDRVPNLPALVQQAIDRSRSPNQRIIAEVSYDQRQLAKDHGFRWDKNQKIWQQTLKACEIQPDYYPFPIKIQDPSPTDPNHASLSHSTPPQSRLVPASPAIPNPPAPPLPRPTPPVDRPLALPPPPAIDDLPF